MKFALALAAGLAVAGAAVAQTAVPAPPAVAAAAKPAKLSSESTVSQLMASEKAKAVLTKHVPHIVNSPQLPLAMEMTFSSLIQFPEAALTPELIKAIDADLAKL
jgi:hypothetical protein